MLIKRVEGRYPYRPKPMRSENIVPMVVRDGTEVRIRLEDVQNDEFWLELTVDLRQTIRDILESN
jgi:hypothetical protein